MESALKKTGTASDLSDSVYSKQVRFQFPQTDRSTQTEYEFLLAEVKSNTAVPPGQIYPSKSSTGTDPVTQSLDMSHVADSQFGVHFSEGKLVRENSLERDILQSDRKLKLQLSGYLIALRPWSFTASIMPVALGSCLAYKFSGDFNVLIFLTTIFTALCVHAAGNLVNTYFDYMRGIDNKKSDDRTLVDRILAPNDVVNLGAVFYIAGCAGFMMLSVLSPAKMEHLALIYFCGLSSSFLYTGGLGLKYIAMGDILIVLTFGPLTVVFSHLSQTGQLSLIPLMYAIPLALNTEAILHCNNVRDMDTDRQVGIITMAILLGKTGSYCLFCFLLFTPYLLFITIGVHYTHLMLLPVISIVLVFGLERQFRRGDLTRMPQQMAQLNVLMGVLYIISIFLSDPGMLPSMTPLQ